jgi:HK97 gp10 family phage protein
MDRIVFEDYSDDVKGKIRETAAAALYEAAGELASQAKQNSRVDLGDLKRSWSYHVDEGKLEAKIGSPLENAIWEEFGTGEYALEGNGRSKPWKYQDRRGNWHTTSGKKPNRTLWKAYTSKKNAIKTMLQNRMKGL